MFEVKVGGMNDAPVGEGKGGYLCVGYQDLSTLRLNPYYFRYRLAFGVRSISFPSKLSNICF